MEIAHTVGKRTEEKRTFFARTSAAEEKRKIAWDVMGRGRERERGREVSFPLSPYNSREEKLEGVLLGRED